MYQTLEIERAGKVATIWMNRPAVFNAFDEQLIGELTLACRKTMRYRMLLGCKALVDGRLLVDPARSYVQNKPLLALGDA